MNRLYPILVQRSFGLLRKAGFDTDLARDVVHDVLQYALGPDRIKATKEVHSRHKLEYYMNRCVWLQICGSSNLSKHSKRTAELTPAIGEKRSAQNYNESLSSLTERATYENIDLMIRRLDEYEAELIRLWSMPGFKYSECSEVTGISVPLLQRQVHDAIKKLKRYVHNSGSTTESIPRTDSDMQGL